MWLKINSKKKYKLNLKKYNLNTNKKSHGLQDFVEAKIIINNIYDHVLPGHIDILRPYHNISIEERADSKNFFTFFTFSLT